MKFFEKFDAKTTAVWILYYFESWSYAKVAKALSISEHKVIGIIFNLKTKHAADLVAYAEERRVKRI